MCVKMGFPVKAQASALTLPANNKMASGDDRKSTRNDEEVKKLKLQCQNGMHFMCSMLSDFDLRRLLAACTYMLGPIRRWHGNQSQTLRCAERAREWYCQMALHGGRPLLVALVKMQEDPALIEKGGLWTGTSLPQFLPATADPLHPFVASQDEVAQRLGNLLESLLNHFVRGFAWHSEGWPGGFAGLSGIERGGGLLEKLKADWQVWKEVQQQTSRFWTTAKARSLFGTTAVLKVTFVLLLYKGGKPRVGSNSLGGGDGKRSALVWGNETHLGIDGPGPRVRFQHDSNNSMCVLRLVFAFLGESTDAWLGQPSLLQRHGFRVVRQIFQRAHGPVPIGQLPSLRNATHTPGL